MKHHPAVGINNADSFSYSFSDDAHEDENQTPISSDTTGAKGVVPSKTGRFRCRWWVVPPLRAQCFFVEALILLLLFLLLSAPTYYILSNNAVTRLDLYGYGSSSAACIYSTWAYNYNLVNQKTANLYLVDYSDADCDLSINGVSLLWEAQESENLKNQSFAGIDYPIPSSVLANYSASQYPILATALKIYASSKLPANLTLTLDNLIGIYNGTILWWNDTLLANELNPELVNCQQPIYPLRRSDPCGATFVLSSVFSDHNVQWKSTYGAAPSINWPPLSNPKNECAACNDIDSNEGMYYQVGVTGYSIGYTVYSSTVNADCCTVPPPIPKPFVANVINRNSTVISDPDAALAETVDFWSALKTSNPSSIVNLECANCWPFVGLSTIVAFNNYRYTGGSCYGTGISDFLKYCMTADPQTPGFVNVPLASVNNSLYKSMISIPCHGGERLLPSAWISSSVIGIVIAAIGVIRLAMGYCRRGSKKERQPLLSKAKWADSNSFVLLEQIGHGASGSVYKGIWKEIEVAVKKVAAEDFKKFKREAQLLKQLRHPNIVLFLDMVKEPPNFYLIMEFCERGSLYSLVHSRYGRKSLSLELRYKMAMDITQGMLYLHTRDPPILHRDLKMHNLLVDKNFQVKIADFGNSREYLTSSQALTKCGTLLTMAPEVFLGKQYTEKADVYSYGLILFELITGQELFPGLQPWVAVRQVANDGLRPPVELVQPRELQDLIQDCWNGTPEARPSFKEILSRLRTIVSKELNLRPSKEQLDASSASPP